MTFPNATDFFRRYLLGKVTEEEKREIEERSLVGHVCRERLQVAGRELLADYVLDRLTEAERESFERCFLNSKERMEKLRSAESFCQLRQWLIESVNFSLGHRNLSRPLWQPLVAISVIVLVALVWGLFFYESPRTRGIKMLYAAYPQERPVEGRLTGFGYGKYRASQNEGVVTLYHDERDEAFRLVISQAIGEKSAASYQALGKMYLAYGDFNRAVARFDLAVRQNPDDAKLRNDLAVALMEREKAKAKDHRQSTGGDRALASEHLRLAVKLAPSLLRLTSTLPSVISSRGYC